MRKAVAQINARFKGLLDEALGIFGRIRVYGANDVRMVQTVYGLTPDEMADVSEALGEAVKRWVAEDVQVKYKFWWSPFADESSQLGASQAVANLSRLSAAYAAARSIQAVVLSDAYKSRVAMAQIKSYDSWKSLAEDARSKLSQIIGRAVVDGKNPKAVRKEIQDAIGVSKSRAMLYAQTDITETLREARRKEAEYAIEQFGMNVGLLWTSALIPTTRRTHAARNGKVYTPEEVREFYGKDGNRYRCHCAQTECLIDDAGKPMLSDALKRSMKSELEAWEKATH